MIKAYLCFQVWLMLLSSHGSTFSQGSFKLQGSTESKVSTGLPVLTLRFRDFFALPSSSRHFFAQQDSLEVKGGYTDQRKSRVVIKSSCGLAMGKYTLGKKREELKGEEEKEQQEEKGE
jgi:hypothetical protein